MTKPQSPVNLLMITTNNSLSAQITFVIFFLSHTYSPVRYSLGYERNQNIISYELSSRNPQNKTTKCSIS